MSAKKCLKKGFDIGKKVKLPNGRFFYQCRTRGCQLIDNPFTGRTSGRCKYQSGGEQRPIRKFGG